MINSAKIGNVPIDFGVLKSMYPNHSAIHNKVKDLEKSGKILRLKKGLYVIHPNESGQKISLELIANHIYGPSYVSMETALRYYGFIPESVYSIKSVTTKHSRVFHNSLGKFEYRQTTNEYFHIGIKQENNNNRTFLIASPEKALCDLLITTPNINLRYKKDVITYIQEHLRFDMDIFYSMDLDILRMCALTGKKKNSIIQIIKTIKQ